jgi:hypothetical protein
VFPHPNIFLPQRGTCRKDSLFQKFQPTLLSRMDSTTKDNMNSLSFIPWKKREPRHTTGKFPCIHLVHGPCSRVLPFLRHPPYGPPGPSSCISAAISSCSRKTPVHHAEHAWTEPPTPQPRSRRPGPLARLASALDPHPRERSAVNGRRNGKRYPWEGEGK